MIRRLSTLVRVVPLWTVVCAAMLAAAVEFFLRVTAREYPLAPGSRFYSFAVFVLVGVIGVVARLWWNLPRISDAELDRILCRECGYDLRASTERCPECGTPIPDKMNA